MIICHHLQNFFFFCEGLSSNADLLVCRKQGFVCVCATRLEEKNRLFYVFEDWPWIYGVVSKHMMDNFFYRLVIKHGNGQSEKYRVCFKEQSLGLSFAMLHDSAGCLCVCVCPYVQKYSHIFVIVYILYVFSNRRTSRTSTSDTQAKNLGLIFSPRRAKSVFFHAHAYDHEISYMHIYSRV